MPEPDEEEEQAKGFTNDASGHRICNTCNQPFLSDSDAEKHVKTHEPMPEEPVIGLTDKK